MQFNRGICAIVGPNGSGKSNVADAVRWVMGEQSLKLLRGKKSEDVIFSGSDKKARLGLAEVSLHINNEDNTMPIDYPQVVITRRVFRSGENEYLLNNSKVRLQDIILLLAKSNFGQRSYSVIGQGMIESVLTSSPQERKEFFDEAAGVRQFQIKKEQAQQKLEHTRENLRQGEMLMQEIEPRLRSLTRQVKRLERRETIEQDLRLVQKEYFAGLWRDISGQLSELDGQQSATNQRLRSATSELRAVQTQLEKIESESSREDAFRQLQKEYNRLLDQKNTLLQDQAVLKGRLEVEAHQAGETNRVWLSKQAEQIDRRIKEVCDDLAPINDQLSAAQTALETKRSEQAVVVTKFEELERGLLLAKERMETSKPISVKEIHDHLKDIETRQAKFIEALNAAQTVEDIGRIKKHAQEIFRSLSQYLTELSRSAPASGTDEVIRLQHELTNFLKSRDSLVNEINDWIVKVRMLEDKKALLIEHQNELEQELNRLRRELELSESSSKQPAESRAAAAKENQSLNQSIETLDRDLKSSRIKIEQFNQVEQQKKEELFALQKQFRDRQNTLNAVTQESNELRVKQARLETRRDDLDREMRADLPETLLIEIQKDFINIISESPASVLLERITSIKHQIELIGGIDENVSSEYEQTNERFEFLSKQAEDLHQAIESLDKGIAELDEQIKDQFDESFQKINTEFTRYFKMLFKGGSAKLILNREELFEDADEDDEDDEFDGEEDATEEAPKQPKKHSIGKVVTGIEIQAIPPGKRVSSINVLSGGEKSLTSIALICAIIANNPSPFVILDEVDAALDESNSIKFSNILTELAHKTQFITITHNRATMQQASILYGVTMGADSVSKLLSVKMEEAEAVINQHGNR
jgi:chromosome segregation protein